MNWISKVNNGTDKNDLPVLYVDAPAERSQEITALLAGCDLFIAEMYQYQASLEKFFLELTGSESGEGSRAGMANFADAVGIVVYRERPFCGLVAEKARPERCRFHNSHLDAEMGNLARKRLREPFNRKFAGRVEAPADQAFDAVER